MFPGAALRAYILNWMYPQPPQNAAYGFRWQAGQGVPNQISIYDLNAGIAPGIYVVFQPTSLAGNVDLFGRLGPGAPGPVFAAPANPSAAVTNLIYRVSQNPPANEGPFFHNVTAQRLCDITGFFSYTATCLDILNHTAAGTQLLNTINAAQYPVFISPAMGGNQTSAANNDYINELTFAIFNYLAGQPMPVQQIRAMIDQRYAAINGVAARFNQLAADMNNLALCSLFQPAGAVGQFLWAQFRFRGQRLTGQNLLNWLSPGGFAVFDQHIRNLNRVVQAVEVKEAFLLALNIVLYHAAPARAGTGAGIKFNVRNEDINVLGAVGFRPPAIGLGHELMHAMHYGRGTAPGYDFGHFTTTAAELLFCGIGPFANQPVTENAIRGQWNAIPGGVLDPSNVWAAPGPRNVYEPPVLPNTPATMRVQCHCI